MKNNQWFSVDKAGLGRQAEERLDEAEGRLVRSRRTARVVRPDELVGAVDQVQLHGRLIAGGCVGGENASSRRRGKDASIGDHLPFVLAREM